MEQKAKELYEKTQADCKAVADREIARKNAHIEQAREILRNEYYTFRYGAEQADKYLLGEQHRLAER